MPNKDYTLKQEQVARFAKAMGHPARIAILQFLAKREDSCFGCIHEELPIAKATVSQHLKELKEAAKLYDADEVVPAFIVLEEKPLADTGVSIQAVPADKQAAMLAQ